MTELEADPHLGLTLADKYLVDSLLGRGGMGAVYRATHLELGEPLAVKFLHGDLARSSNLRSRFRREAVALARLRHPGIVSVIDFGEHGEELYMVMELVRGLTLAELIENEMLPAVRIGNIFDRILQVLEVTHAQGIVHRDLKPHNVMVLDTPDHADHVKLLDFGLVHLDSSTDPRLTETGSVQGTPVYMSPEQCRGREVGPAADIYSIGVTLFEVFSGRVPFIANETAALMAQHMFVEPPPLTDRVTGAPVSVGLQHVVSRALAKDPALRPTARELRDELSRALRGTDAASLAQQAAKERARVAVLSRSERAPTAPEIPSVDPSRHAVAGDDVRVALWVLDEGRLVTLRAALAVNGIHASIAGDLAATQGAHVIVMSASGNALAQLERLRSAGVNAPTLVVDVSGDAAAFVRAGAHDIHLASAGDAKVHTKVRRLLRRGR